MFYLPTNSTQTGMGHMKGNKDNFKAGLIYVIYIQQAALHFIFKWHIAVC
jgi:hypothetical protein